LSLINYNDFDIEEIKVVERQLLKRLKKTLLSPETSKDNNKQASLIEIHEEDNPTNPKKNRGWPLGSKNNKKNPTANNVLQKWNEPTKKGKTP